MVARTGRRTGRPCSEGGDALVDQWLWLTLLVARVEVVDSSVKLAVTFSTLMVSLPLVGKAHLHQSCVGVYQG